MAGPLQGLLVADFSRVVAGPFLTMTLGDLGADVIKVERPPRGDDTRSWGPPWHRDDAGVSTYFQSVNRNRRSVALDLRSPADHALAVRLAERADVVVENFTPGTMERLGLGWDVLSSANPRLVMCSISGFGDAPAARGLPGYDLVAQAASGLMDITGEPDGEPTKVGVAMVDIMTGLHGAVGVLAALEQRHRTGAGTHLSVSLFDAALATLLNQGSAWINADVLPTRAGNEHPSIAPYSSFHARDRPFIVACGNDEQYRRLCELLHRPDLATDARFSTNAGRVEHRHELTAELERLLATDDAATWQARLTGAGVPTGPVNTIAEAIDLGRALGDDPVVEVDGVSMIRSPLRWPRGDAAPTLTPPPAIGEHDAEIRAWLGAARR